MEQVVEQSRGQLEIESIEKEGTVVRIILPIYDENKFYEEV